MAEIELPVHEHAQAQDKVFSKRVALTTGIYAVILALSSLGGHYAMKEVILAQQQASDQWAFYQAKVIREHHYRTESMRLEAELAEGRSRMSPEGRDKFESLRAMFAEEAKRYGLEKEDIRKKAEEFEHERNRYRAKDPNFDFAEALLQISIVLASVSILSTSRITYVVSVLFASFGALLCLNGYFLLIKLPL